MLLQLTPHGTNEMFPDYDNNAKALLVPGGCLLVFDYGATTVEMVKKTSWLRTYRQHEAGGSPLGHPGGQDITVAGLGGG